MTKTIPRRRGKLSKQDPPVYLSVVAGMGFDPGNAPNTTFQDWGLDQTYPPTVGELVGHLTDELTQRVQAADNWCVAPLQEETDDPQGGATDTGGEASTPGGSGGPVPGEPEDGDPVGGPEKDRGDQDPGGAPQVP